MNVYHRLNNLIRYMCDEDFPATIPNIAKAMGVYEQQVKLDIDYLQSYEAPKGHPLFKQYIKISSIDGEPCYHMTAKAFPKLFPMTVLEYYLYNHGLYSMFNSDLLWSYNSDELPFPLTIIANKKELNDYNTDIILTIDKAIRLGESIRLTYKSGSRQTMTPHFIKQDIDTGLLYVIEAYKDDDYIASIPLDEISSCKIVHTTEDLKTGKELITDVGINSDNIYSETVKQGTINPNKAIISPETARHIDCIWSFHPDAIDQIMDEEMDMGPAHVKLKIFEDNPDIIDKIKKDTYCRARATLYGPTLDSLKNQASPNIYYYEDDILGIDAFKRWIRQFASSVIVLEPKKLAYDIYQELV